MGLYKLLAAALLWLAVPAVAQELCRSWEAAVQVGILDAKVISEASGIAASRQFPGRLYHINDSGDGPNLYTTRVDGSAITKIKIAGFEPKDVEDLSLGPCPTAGHCVFIGDIGDNEERRSHITIVPIEELAVMPTKVRPRAIITLKYPDRPHNAEGMALHPSGDLYILTKEMDMVRKQPGPALLFRLRREDMKSASSIPKVLEKVGEIDIPKLLSDQDVWGKIVTSFDIANSGKRVLILTYSTIVEAAIDVEAPIKPVSEWVLGQTYNRIQTPELPQQEAVTFGLTDQDLFFDSEYVEKKGARKEVPLYSQRCSDAAQSRPQR